MVIVSWAKRILWVVLVGAVVGAAGSYRYFITPPPLRFVIFEATWIALSFIGEALLAAVILLLLHDQRFKSDDE